MDTDKLISPLLTDMYQITMAYAYWKSDKKNDTAVFDLFFRRNPFMGEFTIFAGLGDCMKYIETFQYTESDIAYLKSVLPSYIEEDFYDYLSNITTKDLTIYAMDEGTVVFPKQPLLRVEGPLIVVQLLETSLLTLINFASLMTTNAARYRLAVGWKMHLFEFGLRRAQGPNGGMSASKYAYIGGFDRTSNLLAGKLYNIPVAGTHAHSFVTSFADTGDLNQRMLNHRVTNGSMNLFEIALRWRDRVKVLCEVIGMPNNTELAAFVAFAIAFPSNFMGLVDTYDVRNSGLLNFCAVALALNDLEYQALGIRIDSGDLAYLSALAYSYFSKIADEYNIPSFKEMLIIVSNDVNEETILSLHDQNHNISGFGIGTHLVTCQKQPALGCVYKMVEINGMPTMKLSEEFEKTSFPGKRDVYRLYGSEGYALLDLMQKSDESEPEPGQKVLCRHPFDRSKRCYVVPKSVEKLLKIYWKDGQVCNTLPTMEEIRNKIHENLSKIRRDILRILNPTPHKLSLSENTFDFIHDLWLRNIPIGELL